jgi:NitT/TauT family transport system permease protein
MAMSRLLKNLLFYGSLLAAWALIAHAKIWPTYLFPAPLDVWQSLHDGFGDHSFWIAIAVSMKRVVIGYSISVVLGVVLGYGIASSKFLEETVGPLLTSLQSLPSICWLPLAMLWFGLSEKAIYFVIISGSVLSITISMESARHAIPRIYTMAGRNLGAHGWKLFVYVLFPASLPHLVSGIKQGWAFAWRALVSGEMLIAGLGLGQLLMAGRDNSDMNQVLAVMLIIVLIGTAIDGLFFRSLERWLARRWGLGATA